jgi:hypothetical protein
MTMKYMALIYDTEDDREGPQPGTPEFAAYMQPWIDLNARLAADGVLVGGEALMPVATATSVRVRGGRTETMDGPFADTKERLGGFYILDCADLDAALRYAAMIPVAETGTVEVRPIMDLG